MDKPENPPANLEELSNDDNPTLTDPKPDKTTTLDKDTKTTSKGKGIETPESFGTKFRFWVANSATKFIALFMKKPSEKYYPNYTKTIL